jgi:hypothetical protein
LHKSLVGFTRGLPVVGGGVVVVGGGVVVVPVWHLVHV